MAERRRYTAKERARATGIAVVEGVTEAERQTGIPKTTIQYWTEKPEFARLRTTARELVVDQFWVGLQVGLEQVIEGLKGDAPLNHKADALRTIAERYALLTGGATARMESRELYDLPDSAYVDAIRAWENLTRTGSESPAPQTEGAPEG